MIYIVTGKSVQRAVRRYEASSEAAAKIGDGVFLSEEIIDEMDFKVESVELES
jgi:hypothetical protein